MPDTLSVIRLRNYHSFTNDKTNVCGGAGFPDPRVNAKLKINLEYEALSITYQYLL